MFQFEVVCMFFVLVGKCGENKTVDRNADKRS
jgi:hypothetical protein